MVQTRVTHLFQIKYPLIQAGIEDSIVAGTDTEIQFEENPLQTDDDPDLSTTEKIENYIINKMNIVPKQYCFIRCLHLDDQLSFISFYAQQLNVATLTLIRRKEIIDSGGMLLSIWIEYMCELSTHGKLKHSYLLFRHAFWGENRRGKKTNNVLVSHTVLLSKFTGISSSTIYSSMIYLLYQNNHLQQVSKSIINPISNGGDPAVNQEVYRSTIFEKIENETLCTIC